MTEQQNQTTKPNIRSEVFHALKNAFNCFFMVEETEESSEWADEVVPPIIKWELGPSVPKVFNFLKATFPDLYDPAKNKFMRSLEVKEGIPDRFSQYGWYSDCAKGIKHAHRHIERYKEYDKRYPGLARAQLGPENWDINGKTQMGISPLGYAIKYGHEEAAIELVNFGAKISSLLKSSAVRQKLEAMPNLQAHPVVCSALLNRIGTKRGKQTSNKPRL